MSRPTLGKHRRTRPQHGNAHGAASAIAVVEPRNPPVPLVSLPNVRHPPIDRHSFYCFRIFTLVSYSNSGTPACVTEPGRHRPSDSSDGLPYSVGRVLPRLGLEQFLQDINRPRNIFEAKI